MSEVTISLETAEKEFERFLGFLYIDPEKLSEGQRVGFDESKPALIKAIQEHRLVIPDESNGITAKFTSKGGEVFEFAEVTGAANVAMDKVPAGQNVLRIYTFLGYLSKKSVDMFKLVTKKDLPTIQGLGIIFLLD